VTESQAPPAPLQPWPPALIFRCPDNDWTWHASDGRNYEPSLARAWRKHRRERHGEIGESGGQQVLF
jgi:hypothetical protein